jgi:CheY-like chemotaxis protein
MSKYILIVEDDTFSSAILKKILSFEGFEVRVAENGQVALEILLQNPDLLVCFLDLNMPVMDGYTFLEKVREDVILENVRVYITSCNSPDEFMKQVSGRIINMEMIKGYCTKPYYPNDILSLLRKEIAL